MKVRTLAGLAEYQDVFEAQDDLREAYGSTGYVFDVDASGVYDAIPAPSSGSLAELAQLGIDIAKVYIAANGQQVKYVPVQTAAGTKYQQQATGGGLLSNPAVLVGLAALAFVALK